ncbi:MAG: DinB family protein [Acidimicrobiales bacterium]
MLLQREFAELSDEAWRRLRARLVGLTDPEYFWEPVVGCLSVRQHDDGSWHADETEGGLEPAPFTTMAWRLWHLIDLYGEDRAPQWLGVPPQGDPIGLDDPNGAPPASADEALALLDRAHDRWDAHLRLATDEVLDQRVGEVGGRFVEHTRAAYVLHMLDEFIHHGAEVALLRDLWRAQTRTPPAG